MREVGVLVLVFVPLDVMLDWNVRLVFHYPDWMHGYLNWITPERFFIFFSTIVAIVMLRLGIKLETEATVELEAERGDNHNADSDPAL
jgi:hypothetical protein